jgi:hypothetical protein
VIDAYNPVAYLAGFAFTLTDNNQLKVTFENHNAIIETLPDFITFLTEIE